MCQDEELTEGIICIENVPFDETEGEELNCRANRDGFSYFLALVAFG